jgi:hypothetical protein
MKPPITEHHSRCEKYDPIGESMRHIELLLLGIEQWAAEEDGIPDFIIRDYESSKLFVGQLPEYKSATSNDA